MPLPPHFLIHFPFPSPSPLHYTVPPSLPNPFPTTIPSHPSCCIVNPQIVHADSKIHISSPSCVTSWSVCVCVCVCACVCEGACEWVHVSGCRWVSEVALTTHANTIVTGNGTTYLQAPYWFVLVPEKLIVTQEISSTPHHYTIFQRKVHASTGVAASWVRVKDLYLLSAVIMVGGLTFRFLDDGGSLLAPSASLTIASLQGRGGGARG